jgi:hypothetical protein
MGAVQADADKICAVFFNANPGHLRRIVQQVPIKLAKLVRVFLTDPVKDFHCNQRAVRHLPFPQVKRHAGLAADSIGLSTSSAVLFLPAPSLTEIKSAFFGIYIRRIKQNSNFFKADQLLGMGIKKEIARYVLPNACETQIIMTMNFRELRHFIKLRTSSRALPEMRAVAGEIKRIMKEMAPKVFADL